MKRAITLSNSNKTITLSNKERSIIIKSPNDNEYQRSTIDKLFSLSINPKQKEYDLTITFFNDNEQVGINLCYNPQQNRYLPITSSKATTSTETETGIIFEPGIRFNRVEYGLESTHYTNFDFALTFDTFFS